MFNSVTSTLSKRQKIFCYQILFFVTYLKFQEDSMDRAQLVTKGTFREIPSGYIPQQNMGNMGYPIPQHGLHVTPCNMQK